MTSPDPPDLDAVAAATAEPTRGLLREALVCLDAGAHRAAITLAWSAVVADLLTKFRRIDASGPETLRARIAGVPALRTACERGQADPLDAVSLEQTLLGLAESECDMISPAERQELARLFRDRQHAIHPSMTPLAEPFVATADAARTHVQAVAWYLVERDGVQGSHALDGLWTELASDYFSRDSAAAEAQLRGGPLRAGRPATTRSAVEQLTRRVLVDLRPAAERARHHAALAALVRMHEAVAVDTLVACLPATIAGLDDAHFPNVVALLAALPGAWAWIGEPARAKVRTCVAEARGPEAIDVVHDALAVAELLDVAAARVRELDPRGLAALLERGGRTVDAARVVALLGAAQDVDAAERLAVVLLPPVLPVLGPTDAAALLAAIADRDPLFTSTKLLGELLPDGFEALRRLRDALAPAWRRLHARMLREAAPGRSERLRVLIVELYPELA